MRIHSQIHPWRISSALLLGLALFASNVPAAEKISGPAPKFKEADLIKVLQSNAAPEEKAIACKRLAVCGTKEAVPALAKLLPDEQLTSWVRIALEAIPGSAA